MSPGASLGQLPDLPDLRGDQRLTVFRQLLTLVERDAATILARGAVRERDALADLYCARLCAAVRRALDNPDAGVAA